MGEGGYRGGKEAEMREKASKGRLGVYGMGRVVKGRWREGRSAGFCSEGIQSMWQGEDRVEMELERRRRSLARVGWWAPEERVEAEKRAEVESLRTQKDGKRDLAKANVRTRAKSSADCWEDW